jgi:hypothetical protein
MNGVVDALVIDLDGDTSISAPTDDQIDIEIGGFDDFTITANSLNVLAGSYITMADETWVGLGAAAGRLVFDITPNPDQIEVTTADLYFATTAHGIIHVDGVTAGMVLRADGTRYIPSTLDVADLTDLAYAVPALYFGTASAAGIANTVIRSDATLAIFDVTNPVTLTVSTSAATGSAAFAARRDHAHAITSSSNPGAAASILASNSDGGLQLLRLGLGANPDTNNRLTVVDGGQIGQAAGPLLAFDDSNNLLEITGCKVGIGTTTVPHGAVGYAMLALDGAASNAAGPHMQFSVSTDDYPTLQILNWAHDNVTLNFDMYYDGGWKSSDAGSSFQIRKITDQLRFSYGVAGAGDVITMSTGMAMDTSGKVFINDTSNADMTIGLTLNQSTNTDELLCLKNTDVTHGMTDYAETDTFGTYNVLLPGAGGGGIILNGYTDDSVAAAIVGRYADSNTTKTGAGRAPIEMISQKKSGTGIGNVGADDNVFNVQCYRGGANTTLFIVDEDGDLFADGGTATTNMVTKFDEYDDAHLVRAFDHARSGPGLVRSRWDDFVQYNESKLVELGILGASLADGGLINVTRLQQLHNGAIWQNYTAIQEIREQFTAVVDALKRLGVDPATLLGGGA